jgi:hypothetical protein
MEPTDDPDELAYRRQYTAFVEPGNVTTWSANQEGLETRAASGVAPARQPQMPAYHLQRADGSGITLVNIGVGPSNAKTVTDHVAVLRPHGWLMLGHCAGLSASQRMGIMCWRTPMYATTTCSMTTCRCGCRFRRWPKCSWRCRMRWPASPSSKAMN